MASRRQNPGPSGDPDSGGGWVDPEVAPASGGHLTPEVPATGPLFDDLAGSPEPRTRPDRAGYPGTQTMPAERVPAGARRRGAVPRRRVAVRRVKRTLRHVDPISVMKISFFFYGIFLVVWLLFAAILYATVSSMGVFDAIESISEGFALDFKVEINLWFIERWAFIIGFVIVVLGSVINTIAAFLYNVAADTIGGIEMTFVERDG